MAAVAKPLYYLQIHRFLPAIFNKRYPVSAQIAAHLLHEIEALAQGRPCKLNLPSAMELAGFYHCTVLDVLDGLYLLKQNGFEYQMGGLDVGILLTDSTGHCLKDTCGEKKTRRVAT